MEYFDEGDHVVYYPTGAETNPTSGVIKKKIIDKHKQIDSQEIDANDEMPRYVIENDKTHKETAYKHENIIKKFDVAPEETDDLEIEVEEDDDDEDDIDVEDFDDDVYNPNAETEEEFDEKEYIRDICND